MKTLKLLFPLVVIGLLLQLPAVGQEVSEEEVFYELDQQPEYPGGIEKLKAFISENVSYPEDAKKEGIQGKVFISFTVDKQGGVVKAEIAKEVHPMLDEEALRVVKSMPDWAPGKKDGHPVNVRFTIPVEFKLTAETKD